MKSGMCALRVRCPEVTEGYSDTATTVPQYSNHGGVAYVRGGRNKHLNVLVARMAALRSQSRAGAHGHGLVVLFGVKLGRLHGPIAVHLQPLYHGESLGKVHKVFDVARAVTDGVSKLDHAMGTVAANAEGIPDRCWRDSSFDGGAFLKGRRFQQPTEVVLVSRSWADRG